MRSLLSSLMWLDSYERRDGYEFKETPISVLEDSFTNVSLKVHKSQSMNGLYIV